MTLPDLNSPDKPARPPRRWGLWLPYLALFIGVGLWSAYWLWLEQQVTARMHAAPGHLAWDSCQISGYPFRLDVKLTGVHASDGAGWALAAPVIKAEAFAFSPGQWVMVAPDSISFTRPLGGPVVVQATVLRASVSHIDERPVRISIEGADLNFSTPVGAHAYFLRSAKAFHFHSQAGPQDQGAIYLEIEGGRPTPGTWVGTMAAGGEVDLIVDGIFSRAHALSGTNLAGILSSWAASGGAVSLRNLSWRAGRLSLETKGGRLGLDPQGRLSGRLKVRTGDETSQRAGSLDFAPQGVTLEQHTLSPALHLY